MLTLKVGMHIVSNRLFR